MISGEMVDAVLKHRWSVESWLTQFWSIDEELVDAVLKHRWSVESLVMQSLKLKCTWRVVVENWTWKFEIRSSGKNSISLIMHANEWACHRKSYSVRAVQKFNRSFGGKKLSFCLAKFRISLLQLGPTIYGGTPGIITYMQSNGLLATTTMCTRFIHYITISLGVEVCPWLKSPGVMLWMRCKGRKTM